MINLASLEVVSGIMQFVHVLDINMSVYKIQVRVRTAITRASGYMTGLYNQSEEFCNYALALSTFSMLREPSGRTPRTVSQMVADLKTRIITSKDCETSVMCCYHYSQ